MIYLDNSATTQPCAAALDAVTTMLAREWFNPSALYREAVQVEKRIAECRERVAACVGEKGAHVTFTGSGTEADSLSILGTAQRLRGGARFLFFAGEHSAVLRTAPQLEAMGHRVETVPATDEGVLDLDALAGALSPEVRLVCCMHVGNETGAVQPLSEIAALLREKSPEALLQVDGVQGFLRVPIDLQAAGVDLYAISAHKLHGPKGVGALIRGPRARIAPVIEGGGQEGGLRSGTENTAGIAGLSAAAGWVLERAGAASMLREIKLSIFSRLREAIDGLYVNGPPPEAAHAAPHILNVSLPYIGGEVMLHALEGEGVLVGTGSACSSKKKAMSPAFLAMRAPAWTAESAIRISIGLLNTMEEAEEAAAAIIRCYRKYAAYRRK